MSSNQLPTLPDVDFLPTDPQSTIDELIGGYEQLTGTTLADGDPRRLYFLAIAYVIVNLRQQVNQTGKEGLLYYASGDVLDHIGAFRKTPRIQAEPAVTTIRFTLSSIRPTNVGIPQGTRVTHNNQLYWRTTEPATIVAGQTFVDVSVEAMTTGEIGNGLAVGEINRLVDPIPYVASVANQDITAGGRDKEDDESYRYRIYQAPAGFSIAGPEDAYRFHALSASSAIVDVSPTSPNPGEVNIVVLLEDGGIPTQSILDLVEAACNPKTIRPLTDQVTVDAPTVVNYDITATYYIRTDDSASAATIQQRVQDAIDDYVSWQHSKLGRDIDPGELNRRVREAGAKRIAITAPTLTAVADNEVAKVGTITVDYGGLENE